MEEAVDTEPEDPGADPLTYTGRWRKFKWTPLSRATGYKLSNFQINVINDSVCIIDKGDKNAVDILKKTIHKLALQKMTQQRSIAGGKSRKYAALCQPVVLIN